MGGTEAAAKLARGPGPMVTVRGARAAEGKSYMGNPAPTTLHPLPDSWCITGTAPWSSHRSASMTVGSWFWTQRPPRPECQNPPGTLGPCPPRAAPSPHTVPRLAELTCGSAC